MSPETASPGGPASTPVPHLGMGTIVRHVQFGVGHIVAHEPGQYVIVFRGGDTRRVAVGYDGLAVEERKGDPETDRIRQAVRDVLGDHGRIDVDLELAPEEKLELHGYITRCYGSLTTFNVLFDAEGSRIQGTSERD